MIRFRDKVYENYFIDPVTALITDENGVEQKTYISSRGWVIFKKMAVHRIQAHTYYGFMPDKDVHHLDENKLNNALSNLKYVTRSEHAHIHGLTRPRT